MNKTNFGECQISDVCVAIAFPQNVNPVTHHMIVLTAHGNNVNVGQKTTVNYQISLHPILFIVLYTYVVKLHMTCKFHVHFWLSFKLKRFLKINNSSYSDSYVNLGGCC